MCIYRNEFLFKLISARSSHPEVFLGRGVLKICSKFSGENFSWVAASVVLN